ncbi:hypothetical protein DRJ19_01845 [Candidatus Woesearchaeota archaeon]|nr:MAG: hypothetical protein DRJ19_01845 [Candidatus Woesearchaeota archaeon]
MDWVAETLLAIYEMGPVCNVCLAKRLGMSRGGISRRTHILEDNDLISATDYPCSVCGKTYSYTWALTTKGQRWLERQGYKLNPSPIILLPFILSKPFYPIQRQGYKLNPPPAPPSVLYSEPGWPERMPRTTSERRYILETYGREAFLDPDGLRYPVVNMDGEYDCMGIRAAYTRAKQYGEEKIAKKALRLAKKLGCEWALRHARR